MSIFCLLLRRRRAWPRRIGRLLLLVRQLAHRID
tara:strand:- start:295 stop:396 length:102 start_codon:yes stop_codon:yes gene_type:complete